MNHFAEEKELLGRMPLGVAEGAVEEAAAFALRVAEAALAFDEEPAPEAVLLFQVGLAAPGPGQVGEEAARGAPFQAEAEGGDFEHGAVGEGVAGHERGVMA